MEELSLSNRRRFEVLVDGNACPLASPDGGWPDPFPAARHPQPVVGSLSSAVVHLMAILGSARRELLRPLAPGRFRSVIDVDDVRVFALTLPRTTEALVRDRVKFRVGRIVYLAFSLDETVMGFAFPKEEREALVRSEPHKFLMPDRADLRYQWLQVRLDEIDEDEMRELVLDAWRMVVPKRVAAEQGGSDGRGNLG